MLYVCCFFSKNFREPLSRFGDGSLLPICLGLAAYGIRRFSLFNAEDRCSWQIVVEPQRSWHESVCPLSCPLKGFPRYLMRKWRAFHTLSAKGRYLPLGYTGGQRRRILPTSESLLVVGLGLLVGQATLLQELLSSAGMNVIHGLWLFVSIWDGVASSRRWDREGIGKCLDQVCSAFSARCLPSDLRLCIRIMTSYRYCLALWKSNHNHLTSATQCPPVRSCSCMLQPMSELLSLLSFSIRCRKGCGKQSVSRKYSYSCSHRFLPLESHIRPQGHSVVSCIHQSQLQVNKVSTETRTNNNTFRKAWVGWGMLGTLRLRPKPAKAVKAPHKEHEIELRGEVGPAGPDLTWNLPVKKKAKLPKEAS